MTAIVPSQASPRTRSARSTRPIRYVPFLIFMVSLAPTLAAYVAYYFWQPDSRINHGELLNPPYQLSLKNADVVHGDSTQLHGKWVMLFTTQNKCDANCQHSLHDIRQIRTAQGRDMVRVANVWLVGHDAQIQPAVTEAVLKEQPNLIILRSHLAETALDDGRLQLVDPQGNAMMRYFPDVQGQYVLQDLQRLLKYSGQSSVRLKP